MRHLTSTEISRIAVLRRVYDLTDAVIAERLGIGAGTVAANCERLGLPKATQTRKRLFGTNPDCWKITRGSRKQRECARITFGLVGQ